MIRSVLLKLSGDVSIPPTLSGVIVTEYSEKVQRDAVR